MWAFFPLMEKKKKSALIPKTYINFNKSSFPRGQLSIAKEQIPVPGSGAVGRLPRAGRRDSRVCQELAPLFQRPICWDNPTAKAKGPATFPRAAAASRHGRPTSYYSINYIWQGNEGGKTQYATVRSHREPAISGDCTVLFKFVSLKILLFIGI